MPVPAKSDPVKFCRNCGALLTRKRFGKRLEDRTRFLSRETCGQSCGNTKEAIQADSHRWRARQVKERRQCAACATTENLHVHHKDRNPANNSLANLEVLCQSCHMKLHWREDRESRLEAKRIGDLMNRQLGGGKWSSVVKRRLLPKQQGKTEDIA